LQMTTSYLTQMPVLPTWRRNDTDRGLSESRDELQYLTFSFFLSNKLWQHLRGWNVHPPGNYLGFLVWECLASVSGSSDMSEFGKFVPLLSFELRRGRVLGEMVNVVLLVQWFGMYAGALIDESDQMRQCVTDQWCNDLAVSLSRRRSIVQQVVVKVVSSFFHPIIRAVSMLALRSDIETKKFLSDSRSITPNTPTGRKTMTELSKVRVCEHVR